MVSAAQEFRSLTMQVKQRVAKAIEIIKKEPRTGEFENYKAMRTCTE